MKFGMGYQDGFFENDVQRKDVMGKMVTLLFNKHSKKKPEKHHQLYGMTDKDYIPYGRN